MARRAVRDWSTATTSVASVREPSMVRVGVVRVSSSSRVLPLISGTASTMPSTPWSMSRDRADSIAKVSSESAVAVLTAYPALLAAPSMPDMTAARE